MNRRRTFKQGDIIMMNFNPTKGHEQNGYRPALVVSNDDFNVMCGGVIKVAAITSNDKEFPLHIEIPAGLPVYGKVELDHERSIDSQSADRECEYVCSVPSEFLDEILQKLDLTYKKSH
ncbi:type II toxin-antitoxin system PemK/MazF family toxin [Lactobacillus crispatus]|uniref:mRNA interferase n=1 Tax=Lactobacillus crispatus TaxID=47770 RepID=A0A7H9E9P5_9LACO|nr:type II toxin-antitoxin system PemK/MazF family toxin [Lactobacillus crispatus]QLL74326.1 type II toxin-antitoxin system PemK/MazF family toxin [Lactobacillus crispatus]